MAKARSQFQCCECASILPKWSGQCPECKSWNAIEEIPITAPIGKSGARWPETPARSEVMLLKQIPVQSTPRFSCEITELDRVLGGGLVPGSVVLLGGDPGIGKSTLLLQCLTRISQQQQALYVTGEESLQQVRLRAQRLKLPNEYLKLLSATCVEEIIAQAISSKPTVMVIDSIQTVFSNSLQSAPGSVSQIRESAAILVRLAKQSNIAIFLDGHVTKEGLL
ncbi:MAG: AAA family ATPase, partial [Gammaproteobacteria bacterium]